MVEVELFPNQTETDGLFVIVPATTGVAYSNQCGGTACNYQRAEGFLVPVGSPRNLDSVKAWFRSRFGESCWLDGRIAADPVLVLELATIIAELQCWADGNPIPLEVDMDRLVLGGEAWVPVRSPFGLGWLTWTNSD
jgi:hypothetical protein